MSLKIIKAGVLDTLQDKGRLGAQDRGINPGGAMDVFSAKLANCLIGKEMDSPVIEMHFPAPVIQFSEATIICITGANFSPAIDKKEIPLHQPVVINENSILTFNVARSGARCYLSILQKLQLEPWLNSYSTNLKAQAGGLYGRSFQKGNIILFEENNAVVNFLNGKNFFVLPWMAKPFTSTSNPAIAVIEGSEWNWLNEESKQLFLNDFFFISTDADRMGFRLLGKELQVKEQKQLVSSGVAFGTIQLLPNGQLIVLMADHQTTGGYPRIANIISADLPAFAQMRPKETVKFFMTSIDVAEEKLLQQHAYLLLVQYASSFKIQNLFA